jgi:hypothetical protein
MKLFKVFVFFDQLSFNDDHLLILPFQDLDGLKKWTWLVSSQKCYILFSDS